MDIFKNKITQIKKNIYKLNIFFLSVLKFGLKSLAQSAMRMRQILCWLSEKVSRQACTEKKHET